MRYEEFLKSVLTNKQIKELNSAVKQGKAIVIKGTAGATGKTTLRNVLIKKGYKAYEEYEILELELNKVQKNLIPNLGEELS